MTSGDLNVVHAAQLAVITDDGSPRRGPDQGQLNLVPDGAVAIRSGRIVAAGPTDLVLRQADDEVPTIDATGMTVLPGLVESHSHPLFARSRHDEFAVRLGARAGQSTASAARSGQVNSDDFKSGFWANVIETRESSDERLLGHLAAVYQRILRGGVTTLEVKSGYGLTVDEELRELDLLRRSGADAPLDLVYTFLGAHSVPPGSTSQDYVDLVVNEMLPAVLRQGIAEFHDITCERDYFTPEQAARLLRVSRDLGLPTRVHADGWQPSGGWPVASAGGATAADHLTFVTDEEIRSVGRSDTIAVLLPAAELTYMTSRRANARLFIEEQVPVAIATDYCSAIHATSLLASLSMACPWFGLTPAESIVGATLNAAYVLGRGHDRGSLDVGKRGDVLILNSPHPDAACMTFGGPIISHVISQGVPVYSPSDELLAGAARR